MKIIIRSIVMIFFVLINIIAIGQISWEQYSPINTGNNPLGTDGINKIEKIGDTLVFMSRMGVSFKFGNQWFASDAHLSNLEYITGCEFASDGNMYLAAGGWGAFEVHDPNYLHNRNSSYFYNSSNSILASDSNIMVVEEGPNGKIWFGTFGAGIFIKNGSQWTRLRTTNSGLLNDTIYDMEFHNGKMFIGTHRGLSVYNSGSWTNMPNYSTGVNGLYNPHVLDLFFDNDDSLWVSTYWGVSKWDGDTSFTTILQTNGLLDNAVCETTQDTLGNMWFLHTEFTHGLTMYDGSIFNTYTAGGSIGSLPYDDITCIEFDAQNNLWVGTEQHGAMKYNGNIWEIYDLSNSQAFSYVGSVGFDSHGSFWVSSPHSYGNYFNQSHRYSKFQNGQWNTFKPITNTGFEMGSRCYSQFLDDNGRHWFSSRYKGIFYEENGVFYNLDTINSIFPDNRCDKFYQGKNGVVWVSTMKGLVKFDNNLNITVYNTSNSGIAHNQVWDVAVDSSGTLWAATRNGLSKYDGNNWTTYDTLNYGVLGNTNYENSVYRVEIDGNQNVWISIFQNGILSFDGTNWTHYTDTNSALLNAHTLELYTDRNGSVWACQNGSGISKFVNGNWINYIDTIHLAAPTNYYGNIFYYAVTEDSIGNLYLASFGHGVIKLSMCASLQNSISIIGDSTFCTGDSVILQANNSAGLVYNWYNNGSLIPNEHGSFITTYNQGNYKSQITDTLWGCTKTSQTQNIAVNTNNFNIEFSSNDTIQTSPPFNTTFINQTPQLINYSFLWEFGDGNSSNYYQPFHQYQYDGIYDVKLTATHNTTGCISAIQKNSFIITSGGVICNITATITPSGTANICVNDSILLNANSGAGYTYQWVYNGIIIPNADSAFYYAKQSGHYAVVINNSTCSTISQPFVLNHYPANLPQIIGVGSLQPCTTDSMQLTLNSFYQNYQWSTGDTIPTIWINQTGYYYIDVIDQFGCSFTSPQMQISNSSLQPPSICIVGVDSASGKNRIIWERKNTSLIDSIVIFRETNIANVYDRIGALPYSQSGIFTDNVADPAVRAWRYKLAAVDTCGALSLNGPLHKTIHLTINAGLNGTWNLLWDNYVGFTVNSYFIYRGTSASNMQLLAQVPGNLTSFTDLNPPTGIVYYQLEIRKSGACYPDSVYSKANTNYNSVRSNRTNNTGITPIYLTADFDANITSGSWPIKINFNDMSTGNPMSWQWDFGDGNNSTMQNPSHTYNNVGSYTITLKVVNGLYNDSIQKVGYVNVLSTGDVEFYSATTINVFPNPNNGIFTIDLNTLGSKMFNLRVYNILGDQVHAQKMEVINQSLFTIDLSAMSKGVYFIRLDNSTESIGTKLILE